MPYQEIPVQETRKAVEKTLLLEPDVNDFVEAHMQGRGDLDHVINGIVRVYRDNLPAGKRGPLGTAPKTGETTGAGSRSEAAQKKGAQA